MTEPHPLPPRARSDAADAIASASAAIRHAGLCAEQAGLLVLVDRDGFKPVNDTFGHAAGDACLKEGARRLAGLCRGADLAACVGGDAFAILLDGDPGLRVAEALAQRIVRALGEPMRCGVALIRIGASVGIGAAAGRASADAFARADAALYAAKAAGRNTFRRFGATVGAA